MLDPAYAQRDHRVLVSHESSSRDHWFEVMRSWWELVPDVRVVEFEPLAASGDRVMYRLGFEGHDALSGGVAGLVLYVVNRLRDGAITEADMFDDRAAAAALVEPSG